MPPNPKRAAALRAAAKATCFGVLDCGCCNSAASCWHWSDYLDATRAAIAAYQRAMGRDVEARQVEAVEVRDE